MNISKRAFTINGLILWLTLSAVFCGSDAEMKTLFMEDLCNGGFETKLSLRFYNSAILSSIPGGPLDCKMQLLPEISSSVAISFYRYNLEPSDTLSFRDSVGFELSLTGRGVFLDERKSLIFDEGPLTIHYITNHTIGPKLRFQLVFTQVRDGPCFQNEFKCRNNKCIAENLACDKHNHCGDLSDQENCSPRNIMGQEVLEPRVPLIGPVIIIIVSGIFGIILIVLIAVAIRGCVVRRKKAQQPQLPTVAAASEAPQVAPQSVFGRLRESFRIRRPTAPPLDAASAPEHTPSENYEVPSMYPRLPAGQKETGIDNPEFKAEN